MIIDQDIVVYYYNCVHNHGNVFIYAYHIQFHGGLR